MSSDQSVSVLKHASSLKTLKAGCLNWRQIKLQELLESSGKYIQRMDDKVLYPHAGDGRASRDFY